MPLLTPKLVTIGLPTYNRAGLLRETLDGLLRQDYEALEIIVSDNHSTDDTPQVCAEYGERDPRVRYVRQRAPVAVAENFTTPLRLGTGEYFMWAADDDARDASFVSTLESVLRSSPGTAMVAGEAQYRLPGGGLLPFFAEGAAWYDVDGSRDAEARLGSVISHSYGNLIYGLYRRAALLDGESTVLEGWRSLNEIPVFLQIAARGEICVIPQVLMQKTAPIEVYLAAAAEYGVTPQLDRVQIVGSHSEQPSGVRHALGASRQVATYHVSALRDALRAISSLPLPVAVRGRVAARMSGSVARHGIGTIAGIIHHAHRRAS